MLPQRQGPGSDKSRAGGKQAHSERQMRRPQCSLAEDPAGHWTLRPVLFFSSARVHGSREPGDARGAGLKGFFWVHHSWVPPPRGTRCRGSSVFHCHPWRAS